MAGVESVRGYYGRGSLADRLVAAIRDAGLDTTSPIAPEDLAPLDQFHTGGKAATESLLDGVGAPATSVLDVGAGLGGSARLMAHRWGCRVTCVDLTPEFCAAARLLNEMTGLAHLIDVHEGSALDLPFPDAAFDLVWMQNVSMNIADKATLYREAQRVLRPAGRIALQEVVSGGNADPLDFPVPWADDPSMSFLVTAEELRRLIVDAGFELVSWVDASPWALRIPPRSTTGALGVHVYLDDASAKFQNSRHTLEDGRTALLRVVAQTSTRAA